MVPRAQLYRDKALIERRAAAATNLPNVRERHIRAAENWEHKADFEERHHNARELNLASKRIAAKAIADRHEMRRRMFARHARG